MKSSTLHCLKPEHILPCNSEQNNSVWSNYPMDQSLVDAARTGDLDAFYALLHQDPFLLEKIDKIPFSQTPLHIAVLARQTRFAMEMMNLKPSFLRKLDLEGYSPLHLASITGQVEMVRDFMTGDGELCLLKGREKRTPLHCAAMAGCVDLINLLLEKSPRCFVELTVRKETALHLAVKNNQLSAFRTLLGWIGKLYDKEIDFCALQLVQDRNKVLTVSDLLRGVKLLDRNEFLKSIDSLALSKLEDEQFLVIRDWLRQIKKENLVNWKDDEGNTILHLAVYRKQIDAIEELFTCREEASVEVNSLNANNLTALDILLKLPRESGDERIKNVLYQAGAITASEIVINPLPTSIADTPTKSSPTEFMRFSSSNNTNNSLIIVASLIAITCFLTGINPPGGVWQQSFRADYIMTGVEKEAGTAIRAMSMAYTYFMTCNMAAFFISLSIIAIALKGSPSRGAVLGVLSALSLSYISALALVLPDEKFPFVQSLFLTQSSVVVSSLAGDAWRDYERRKDLQIKGNEGSSKGKAK